MFRIYSPPVNVHHLTENSNAPMYIKAVHKARYKSDYE